VGQIELTETTWFDSDNIPSDAHANSGHLTRRHIPAPDVEVNGKTLAARVAFARNTAPSSVAGLPGLVLPTGITRGGLPVGLELDGGMNSDRELLALGLTVNKVLGRIPPPRI
jgi:Asp-tRNA(Asn)/Glu-tRNA(Gln) amidotransferase A subunit family amidase